MKELLKIFSVLFFISLLTFSTIGVFAEDSTISNQTNETNNTNTTNLTRSNTSVNAPIQPMSVSVTLNVNPTSLNLGTIAADGIERTFTGATTARVQALGLTGDLYVRATGDFVNSANSSQRISLSNFQYSGQHDSGSISKRLFTTTSTSIHRYTYLLVYDNTYTMNYYLTVPAYTDPGTYTTTIIYTAT